MLLFLGRVHEKKGADLLFKALASLREREPELLKDVQLVMAGATDHPYGRQMQALVKSLGLDPYVTWTDHVGGAVKWGAFRMADAFILPSHQENFGIAVAEAMACGVPVLISRQVNIWREIKEAGAGFVEADTLEGTARLIEKWLLTPPEDWQQMRVNAQSCFHQRFLIDRTAESLVHAVGQTKRR